MNIFLMLYSCVVIVAINALVHVLLSYAVLEWEILSQYSMECVYMTPSIFFLCLYSGILPCGYPCNVSIYDNVAIYNNVDTLLSLE